MCFSITLSTLKGAIQNKWLQQLSRVLFAEGTQSLAVKQELDQLTRNPGLIMADSFSQMAQEFHNRVAEIQEVALLRVDGKFTPKLLHFAVPESFVTRSDLVL